MEAEMQNILMSIITVFLFITAPYPAHAEEPTPSETTEEVAPTPSEEVAPSDTEAEAEKKVEEVEKVEATEEVVETIPTTDQEAVEDALALWKALNSQDWPLAIGFLVMILVYIANRFGLKDKIGKKAIPYVSLAIGVLAAVGVALASGSSVAVALEAGVLAGLAAVGSWEVLFKKILGDSNDTSHEVTEEA
jgi:hypothetical protein